MTRLSGYLVKLFSAEALSFFLVAAFLVYITQTLRLFDLVTAKGQDVLTLLGQSALTTPPLGLSIIYICMGIGLVRALRALQASRELHTIHASGRTRAIVQAVFVFILGGVIAVSLIAHWGDPWSKKAYTQWSEQVTADLVGRALSPHRFSEVAPGLVVVIGGRERDGTITDFFAHDTRDADAARTYVADSAVIVFREDGYNVRLRNGAVQYLRDGDSFTEVGFSQYEIGLDRLATGNRERAELDQRSTPEIIAGLEGDGEDGAAWRELHERFAETVRLIGLCLVSAALTGYPHGRRGNGRLPLEVVILALGLGDRAAGSIARDALGAEWIYAGAIGLLAIAMALFAGRMFGQRFMLSMRRPA